MLTQGRLEKPSPYSDQPTVTTRAFWSSGEANRLMHAIIPVDVPVRRIGINDDERQPGRRQPKRYVRDRQRPGVDEHRVARTAMHGGHLVHHSGGCADVDMVVVRQRDQARKRGPDG